MLHHVFDNSGAERRGFAISAKLPIWRSALIAFIAMLVAVALAGCAHSSSGNEAPQGDGTSPSEVASSNDGTASDGDASSADSGSLEEPGASDESSSASASAGASFASNKLLDARAKKVVPTELKNKVQALVDSSGMEVEVVYVDLSGSGEAFDINGDKPAVAASVIKLAVLAEVFDQAEQGDLSLEDVCTGQPSDIVGGSGVIQGMGAGTKLTVGQLLEYMIADSDNVAANMLINKVGMDKVNDYARKLGLDQTSLNRLMLDQAAVDAGVENYMSANDAASLLESMYRGTFVSKKASARALEVLKNQRIESGIARGVPADVQVAHKTGSLVAVENDAAIVLGARPYVLVVMTSGNASDPKELMGNISSEVWNHQVELKTGAGR